MAKSRAQRKAEKRRRQQAQQDRQPGRPEQERDEEERAQEATQTGVSGEVAEVEAAMETGARTEDYGEHTIPDADSDVGNDQTAARAAAPPPQAPAPSRADVGVPADDVPVVEEPPPPDESRDERRARKEREKEQRRKARAKEQKRGAAGVEAPEKKRGAVTGFIASCWAELKKVQWPDRDTLIQASAVTVIFVFVAAAYLGALDAVFNLLVKKVLL
jgi:preprotein translocase SecE subunit